MTPERIYVQCDKCRGTGGPPPIWDEELSRSITYNCTKCSGRGEYKTWTDAR